MVICPLSYHTVTEDVAQWADSPGYAAQWPCATEEAGYTRDCALLLPTRDEFQTFSRFLSSSIKQA